MGAFLVALAAGSAVAAPLPADSVAEIDRVADLPRYENGSWGIAVRDAETGE